MKNKIPSIREYLNHSQRVDELEEQIVDLNGQRASLEESLKQAKAKLREQESAQQQLQLEMQDLETRLKADIDEVTSLESQLQIAEDEHNSILQDHLSHAELTAALEKQLESVREQGEAARRMLQAEMQSLAGERDSLLHMVQRQKGEFLVLYETVQTLQSQKDATTGKIDSLRQRVKKRDSQIQGIKRENKETRAKSQESAADLANVQGETQALRATLQKKEDQLDAFRRQLRHSGNELESVRSSLWIKESENTQLSDSIARLQSDREFAQAIQKQKIILNSQLQVQIQECEKQLAQEKNRREHEIESLRSQLEQKESELSDTRIQMQLQLESARELEAMFNGKNSTLRTHIEKLQEQIQTLSNEKNQIASENQSGVKLRHKKKKIHN
jgi:chromosome segregation ATPase